MLGIANPWKYGAIGAGILSLLLVGKVVLLNHEVHGLRETLNRCEADLTTSRNNAATLEAAVEDQNANIDALVEAQKKVMVRAAEELAAAQARTKAAERSAAGLSAPIKGSTLEERVLEVDARVLESIR